jgi:transcriptional regulator with XRE-family HTH domain
MARSSVEAGRLTEKERANAPQAISDRLRALMTVAGLTERAVAHLTGTSEGHVAGWLEGSHAPPRSRMNRVARQAGVTLGWIYYGDEDDLPPQTASLLRSALAHNREDLPSGRSPAGPA